MARPKKNNCDYFTHDNSMRNHRKVKSLRTKFGIQGYGIWCMLLEYLTEANGNEFEHLDEEIELISGDFGIDSELLFDIISYCVKIGLLTLESGFIHSKSLDERLAPVYQKRAKSKGNSEQFYRVNGRFCSRNSEPMEISASEIPHSKVNKSKVNETKDIAYEVTTQPTDEFSDLKSTNPDDLPF